MGVKEQHHKKGSDLQNVELQRYDENFKGRPKYKP